MRTLFLAGIIAVTLVSSCKKDLRTKVYQLRAYNNSGLTGQVSFVETKDKSITVVKLEAQGLKRDTAYPTHLHTGTPGNLTGTLIYFHEIRTTTGSVVHEEEWQESYDNALNSNTCLTLHEPS